MAAARLAQPWILAGAWGLVCVAAACAEPTAVESTAQPAVVDPRTLRLATDLDGEQARAGIPFSVRCRAFLPAAAGAGADALGQEVALPAPATVVIVAGPAGPLEVEAETVRLGRTGVYAVACRVPTFALEDPTGAELAVQPGPPAWVETAPLGIVGRANPAGSPSSVTAGSTLGFACSAQDKYSNPIESGFSLEVVPNPAAASSSLTVWATEAGPWSVACRAESLADPTPVSFEVVANVPRHLVTLIEPAQIEAGHAAQLTCLATDAYWNAVADFPFAVDRDSQAVGLKGLYLSSTKAGIHPVSCVPESIAWDLFVLHPATLTVKPGPPAHLAVMPVPQKLVYKQEDKVQFISSVRDAFDNLIPSAQVSYSVLEPKTGFSPKGTAQSPIVDTIKFVLDGTYQVLAEVAGAPELDKQIAIVVDGSPPLVSIDWPQWGATLADKPSVQVKGTAGDAGSGVKSLTVNDKPAYPDAANQWTSQQGALHGLNRIRAEAVDMGEEKAFATRGFYYSGAYYDTDAGEPLGAPVIDGLQVFLGKDFLDDGVHDPAKPDDLATLIEVALASLDVGQLLPPTVSQGDLQVQLSNVQFEPPKISLAPIDGGIDMVVKLHNLKTDLKVKAKQKVGPITLSLSLSGDISIATITMATVVKMAVSNGKAQVSVAKSKAEIDGLKLHVDGIAGLFDFLWNLLLGTYTSDLENQLVAALNGQIPGVLQGLLDQFALNQAFSLPGLLPGQAAVTLQLASALRSLVWSPQGGRVTLDASFTSTKGTPHTVLGAIGRAGCIGTATDAFVIDENQRLEVAIHDDLVNQALYALWYTGALTAPGLPAADLAGGSGQVDLGGFSLEGATLDLDLFLPPIVETCNLTAPDEVRLQVGDAFVQANLKLGADDLKLGVFASVDMGAKLSVAEDAEGTQQLQVSVDPQAQWLFELVSISKDYESLKPTFEKLLQDKLGEALAQGFPGLDKIALTLPSLDLAGLLPSLPAGAKIAMKVKSFKRLGGYTTLNAGLE